MSRVDVAVLVPVKRFAAAKGRLAGVLDAEQRATLARWLADRVIAAARPAPTFVACDDDDVASWADGAGAAVLWSPGLGLNGAVDSGRATLAGKGFEHVVIAHSDLPLAHRLADLATPGTITLVPDRHRDGTNVMALPVARAGRGRLRRRVVRPPPRRSHGRPACASRCAAIRGSASTSTTPTTSPTRRSASLLPPWLRTSLANRR